MREASLKIPFFNSLEEGGITTQNNINQNLQKREEACLARSLYRLKL